MGFNQMQTDCPQRVPDKRASFYKICLDHRALQIAGLQGFIALDVSSHNNTTRHSILLEAQLLLNGAPSIHSSCPPDD